MSLLFSVVFIVGYVNKAKNKSVSQCVSDSKRFDTKESELLCRIKIWLLKKWLFLVCLLV